MDTKPGIGRVRAIRTLSREDVAGVAKLLTQAMRDELDLIGERAFPSERKEWILEGYSDGVSSAIIWLHSRGFIVMKDR